MGLHEYQLRLLSVTAVAQSLLHDLLVNSSEEILAKSPRLTQPNRSAVSIILGPHKGLFQNDTILKFNKKKVFDINNGNALQYPDVKTFDVSMVCALLRRIPDYTTHIPDKPKPCINIIQCKQQCCLHCKHPKSSPCNSCSQSFDECRFMKNLCCSQCQLCGVCQGNPPCEIFELKRIVVRNDQNFFSTQIY